MPKIPLVFICLVKSACSARHKAGSITSQRSFSIMVRSGYNRTRRLSHGPALTTGALAEPIPGCTWPSDHYCTCAWCWENRWPLTDEEETDSESEIASQPPAKKPKVEDNESKRGSARDPDSKV